MVALSAVPITARAHPNIAFIKYWGNIDHPLRLPVNGSLSMNLDGLYTETSVLWDQALADDQLTLNGEVASDVALERVSHHLEHIRKRLEISACANVVSTNNFPMGAGIASSAAAFAALTIAAVASTGETLTERELTILARLGSGSASRSVPAGFVEWHAGQSHEASYAESFAAPDYWPLVDVIAVVSSGHKTVGSSEGHQSADTSDLQRVRVAGAEERIKTCKRAILERDFANFAEVVEYDSNLMHAVMMTSRPPLFYWLPPTLAVMDAVRNWRAEGVEVCYTLDAGPNIHCLCTETFADNVHERLLGLEGVFDVLVARPGGAAAVVK